MCATDATAPSEVAFAAMLTTMCRTGDKAEAWLVVHDPKSVPPPPAPPPIPEVRRCTAPQWAPQLHATVRPLVLECHWLCLHRPSGARPSKPFHSCEIRGHTLHFHTSRARLVFCLWISACERPVYLRPRNRGSPSHLQAPDPKKGRVGRGPSSKMPATQPPPVSPQQEPVDLSKPLHPYAATLHSLKSGGKLKRAVARIFHIPGDSHVPHLSPSALGGHSLDASTAPALLGQRALDYAVDFVVIPETFHIEKPPEPPTPPPPPPPPPVQESKGRPASGKGGRPGSARQGAARPSSGRGTGVEVKEVLAGGTPAPEVRRPRPKPPAKGEVSDQAWEAVQVRKEAFRGFTVDLLRFVRVAEGAPMLAIRMARRSA